MDIQSIFPSYIGRTPIQDTVLQTWIVVVTLSLGAFWARKRLRAWNPPIWQLAIEYLIEYVEKLIGSVGARSLPEAVPYLVTMISFIAIANLLGLLPMFQAPTRDLSTTLALSLISLGSCYVYGIKRRGLRGYLRSLIEPSVIVLPFNILGQMSRMLSMALRLFGNVVAGEVISGVMFMLVPLLSPLVLNFLGMITSVLQALVFTVLTIVFVAEAVGAQEPTAP